MGPQDPHLKLFRESLARVRQDPSFLDTFYRAFIGSSPEVAAVFRNRDMGRIQHKLALTLEMVVDDSEGQPGLGMYLEMLGKVHARLAISAAMFAQWRDALIDTAAALDPEFDEAIRDAWRTVLDSVIAKMGASS